MKGNSILSTPKELSRSSVLSILTRKKQKRVISNTNSDDEFSIKDSLGARISETIAYFLGTPAFIFWLSVFCIVWLGWNTYGPENLRFDSASFGFTALTLMLSLQASYAAPLILLAQNRQANRDKVVMARDREQASRNLADTEYLMREIASIRVQLSEMASRDFIRQEMRNILTEYDKQQINLNKQIAEAEISENGK